MSEANNLEHGLKEIYSKSLRAGRRTYFFDVRETQAGDYYLTITESKKSTSNGNDVSYQKHKIYLYKEDFESFIQILNETTGYIIDEKGNEVISDKHQKEYYKENKKDNTENYSDISFDDI